MPAWVAAWLDDYGSECLTVALDVRETDGHWMPATRGWTQCGSLTLDALAGFYAQAGLRHLLCTDIARDGMLAGPNLGLYAQLRAWAPDLALQADRKSGVEGKSVSVRVDLGGRRIIKKKKQRE